jgi:hypothetical protein
MYTFCVLWIALLYVFFLNILNLSKKIKGTFESGILCVDDSVKEDHNFG